MVNETDALFALAIVLGLVVVALYFSGRRMDKAGTSALEREKKEFEKVSINILGKKADTGKIEIVEFSISVPVIFINKVEVWDNVDRSEYYIEAQKSNAQDGMITTVYEVRIYKDREVVISVTVTGKYLYEEEQYEVVEI